MVVNHQGLSSNVKLTPTQWPSSLPHVNEEKIFSVVCGNTSIKWALHEGIGMNFSPTCCWSTELITDEDMTSASPTSVLGRLLPSGAIRVIFGQEDTITKQKAMEQSQSRSSTLLTVYLVSTNDDQARKVTMCFSEIPSRVFAMQPDDFFTLDQGRYESMGMDRLACMRAAGDMMGFPALVFDGGTCMTYTACDSNGSLVGGGITLGLMAKFAAVSQCSRYAPGMSSVQHHEDMVKYAHDMVLQNKPLDFFSRNTQEAVVSSTLKETAFYCRQVVSKYLTDVFNKFKEIDGKVDNSGDTEKRIPKIIVAGGDSVILQKLLENESNYLLDPNPDARPYSIVEFKHLIAFGIAIALKAKVEKHKSQAITDFDRLLLGCRVAKEFKTLDEDGDRIYRGTIAASVRTSDSEEHQYLVLYDDIDTEEMNLVELHAALTLYSQVGEKKWRPISKEIAVKLIEKKDLAENAIKEMELKDPQVRALVDTSRKAPVPIPSVPQGASISTSKAKNPQIGVKPPNTVPAETLKEGIQQQPPDASSYLQNAVSPSVALKRKLKEPVVIAKAKKAKFPEPSAEPQFYVSRRVGKFFEGAIYFGTVTSYDGNELLWQIDYDDGDEEEFDKDELMIHIKLYESHKDLDKKTAKKK